MKSSRPVALYIYHIPTSFIHIDKVNLGIRYDIKSFEFTIKGLMSIPILWVKQIFFFMKNGRSCSLVFCMFAGYHTILPVLFAKLFRKPCIIVAGGIDSVSFPSVNYGNFTKPILGKITSWSFKMCSHIAPISEYLVDSSYTYQDNDFPRQGFKYHVKNLKTPHTVIYNGFEFKNWYYNNEIRKKNSFLTIAANLDNMSRVKIKGIDLVMEVAALLPHCNFTIIGRDSDIEKMNPTPNVTVLPLLPYESLREVYCQHEFYLQLSMSEGFGNTLAESMLCECIPIGSNAGAIPMIIAESGYILPLKDKELLADLINNALKDNNHEQKRKLARQRILDNFSIEKRGRELLALIDSLQK